MDFSSYNSISLQNLPLLCPVLDYSYVRSRFRPALNSRKPQALVFLIFSLLLISGYCQGQSPERGLDFYLNQAISNSPLLKDYANQISSSALDSELIRAANRPQVLANGQVIVAPVIDGYGYDQTISNGSTYTAMLSVSQPIFTRRILLPQYIAVRLQRASISNSSHMSTLDLQRSITQQYLNTYASLIQYQTNQEVYQLYRDQQQLLHDLTAQGLYKQADYLSFLVALQTQEISQGQLALQFQTGLATLNYLCGIPDTSAVSLSEPRIVPNIPVEKDSSTFFRQFFLDSLTLLNSRAEVDARYRPSVNWFANTGLNSSNLSYAYRNFGASAGVNFSIPIYDGKQRQLQYRKLGLSENSRRAYATFFSSQYDQQSAMLVQQLKSYDALISEIRSKMDNAQLLTDLNKKLLNTGDVRVTDYILAINNYLTIKNDLIQAEISRWQIINQLNYWHH
jgi:outer membrane protein TolC